MVVHLFNVISQKIKANLKLKMKVSALKSVYRKKVSFKLRSGARLVLKLAALSTQGKIQQGPLLVSQLLQLKLIYHQFWLTRISFCSNAEIVVSGGMSMPQILSTLEAQIMPVDSSRPNRSWVIVLDVAVLLLLSYLVSLCHQSCLAIIVAYAGFL